MIQMKAGKRSNAAENRLIHGYKKVPGRKAWKQLDRYFLIRVIPKALRPFSVSTATIG